MDVRYTKENLAAFIPRTTGYFKIYISDYHGPILGSPFYALIHSYKDVPEAANVVESSGIRDTIRNEEAKFIIRNKDLEIDVQIKSKFMTIMRMNSLDFKIKLIYFVSFDRCRQCQLESEKEAHGSRLFASLLHARDNRRT